MASQDTMIARLERQIELAVSRTADTALKLRDAAGDQPLGAPRLPPDALARKYLGGWFVMGQAAPPVGTAFGTAMLAEEGWSPQDLYEWDAKMRQLWDSKRGYGVEAMLSLPPDQRDFYSWLRASGLHDGHPQPTDQHGPAVARRDLPALPIPPPAALAPAPPPPDLPPPLDPSGAPLPIPGP